MCLYQCLLVDSMALTPLSPCREDELNAHGGMWSFKISRKDTVSGLAMVRTASHPPSLSLSQAAVWQEVLLAAVGEQFLSSMETGTHLPPSLPPSPPSPPPLPLSLSLSGDDVCGVSVRIRYEQSVIQIWNLDSELHAKSSVSPHAVGCVCGVCDVMLHILQVIQSVKELIPTIEINEFYQCKSDHTLCFHLTLCLSCSQSLKGAGFTQETNSWPPQILPAPRTWGPSISRAPPSLSAPRVQYGPLPPWPTSTLSPIPSLSPASSSTAARTQVS